MNMKKVLILLAAAVISSGVALAQNPDKGNKLEEKAQHRTERMAKKYGLNAEQQAKLLELNLTSARRPAKHPHQHGPQGFQPGQRPEGAPEMAPGQRPPMPPQGFQPGMPGPRFDESQMKDDLKAQQKAYDKEIKKIFTKEQFKAYKKDRKAMKKKGECNCK